MTALASTAAARHDVLVAFGTLLFIAGAGLLIGCLLAAAIAHYRRRPAPLPVEPVEPVAPSAVDETPTRVIPVVRVFTEPKPFDPDQTAVMFFVPDRDAPTEYLPRHGGPRCC